MIGMAEWNRFICLAAFFALGISRFSSAQNAAAATAARTNYVPQVIVLSFKGEPSVLKGNRWFSLSPGELIAPGSTVRTGPSDSLNIMLDEPGRIISMAAASVVVIDLTKASVNLEAGEIIASIRKTVKDNTSVIIRSKFGVSTVRAADFRVTLTPVPSIAVLDGVVEFEVARAQNTAPALQLRGDAHVIAGPENPLIRLLDAEARGYITGRIDALVSAQGAMAEKFWPRPGQGACHTPTLPRLIHPDVRPGRWPGMRGVEEYSHGAFAMVDSNNGPVYPKGAAVCPVHGRARASLKTDTTDPEHLKPWEVE
jgi:hypothetical protein